MLPFAECCVLIPCSTVEDFPSRLSREDSQSLLGCLTAAWHPRLIASTGRVPTWRRADSWPVSFTLPTLPRISEPTTSSAENAEKPAIPMRLILVPNVSAAKLPADIRSELSPESTLDAADLGVLSELMAGDRPRRDVLIRASSRRAAITAIQRWVVSQSNGESNDFDGQDDWLSLKNNLFFGSDSDPQPTGSGRTITADDFFALGYVWWQIQILTRRLRYTSNLDIAHFEKRTVAAAIAFCENDPVAAAQGLHDAFDALAEERDHYFSSDPSLVDLTLTTPSTISQFLDIAQVDRDMSADDSVLATPSNVLIDETVADWLLDESVPEENKPDVRARLQSILGRPHWGWAGGGPRGDVHFDLLSIQQSEEALAKSISAVSRAVGQRVGVYARLSGLTPPELITAIISEKIVGIIPLSFVDGRGSGDESKVILTAGGHEIEALTATPIDADNDSDFLTLGVRLGEAIDAGEVATGLFVHWPGGGCDSFADLRRAASWTLALGRFWTLHNYFTEGEHPYHPGETTAFTDAIATIQTQPVGERLRQWRTALHTAQHRNASGLLSLISPSSEQDFGVGPALATSLGLPAETRQSSSAEISDGVLVINPNPSPVRTSASISGRLRRRESFVFHSASRRSTTRVIVDVPAFGFACVSSKAGMFAKPAVAPETIPDPAATAASDSRFARFIAKLAASWGRRSSGPSLNKPRKIGDPIRLSNEFLEVSIDAQHGGVAGVYSGASRGNRFSSRLVLTPTSAKQPISAKVEGWDVKNEAGNVTLVLHGTLGDNSAWQWRSQYELARGRRTLRWQIAFRQIQKPGTVADVQKQSQESVSWSSQPMLRVAIAESTPIVRAILREKLHRTSAKSFVAPGGFLLEEDDRSTLVATDGQSLHRRTGDRFFDTLLPIDSAQIRDVDGWSIAANVDFGFDLPHPISEAMKSSEHAMTVPLDFTKVVTPLPMSARGWLMHAAPKSVVVQFVDSARMDDGQRLVHLRLIQTRSKSSKTIVRFCRSVQSAVRLHPLRRPLAGNVLDISDIREAEVTGEIICRQDSIELTLPAHGIVHVLVRFENESI